MRKSGNKIMIVIFTMMIMFSTIPGGIFGIGKAFAADFSGNGSSSSPYLIGTADQLNKVRGSYLAANLYFKLTSNIDLSSYAGAGWVPIGDVNTSFNGHMDGSGYKITGLTIRNGDYTGLFGSIGNGSSIANVKLENVSNHSGDIVGSLVGLNDGGKIENSSATGSVIGGYGAGGLVGSNNGGTIENSYASGSVSGAYSAGGLVGSSNGEIKDSYASADVNGSENVGGLVGESYGGTIISNSHATGSVSGNKSVGGLVGYNTDGPISNSYATGNVSLIASSDRNAGGLVGYNKNGAISSSHALGKVSGGENVGGLVGGNISGAISDSYALGDVIGSFSVGGLVANEYYGTISSSYASGNVSLIQNPASTYASPYAGGLVASNNNGEISNSHATGNVSGSNESYGVGGLVGKNDNSQGGKISNSYATGNVNGGDSSFQVGGLVGDSINGNISNSYATGNVNLSEGDLSSHVGGLVGSNIFGTVSLSYATGKVGGAYGVGGLVGYNDNFDSGAVSNSYALGNVIGSADSEMVGGLVGWNRYGYVNNSYASGQVEGNAKVGGLAGQNGGGMINNSYATGRVSGSVDVGGLVGERLDSYLGGGGEAINSFYDTATTGQSVSAGGVGKSTAQMQDKSTYEADNAHIWDFSNIWAIDSIHNGGYPYLPAIQAYLDYDGNGNTSGTVPTSHSYMPGVKASIYTGTLDLIKTGYTFDGWNTQANGTGSSYNPGDSYIITSNTTLYAKWSAISTIATLTSTIGIVSTGGTRNETITNITYGITLAALKAAITPAANATFEVYDEDETTVATTLASGKKVIVTAQDGTTKVIYTVTVDASSEKELTAFSLAEQTGAATIDVTAHTVAIEVAHGTNLNSLIATFGLSVGASAKVSTVNQVSGVTANDFTTPVAYVITAADGSTQNWTVSVTVAASSEKEVTAFSMAEQTGAAMIDTTTHTVAIEVAHGTSLNGLLATFSLSAGASAKVGTVNQVSGTTANDFTNPVAYVITAADGSTQNWTVTVTVAASSAKELTTFSLAEQIRAATVDVTTHTVAIEVAHGTSLNGLVATFSLSAGASAKVGTVNQVSGATANDFTTPLAYVITAADGSTQNWTVTVTVAASSAKELTVFSFDGLQPAVVGTISGTDVALTVPYGTTVTSLVATFTSSGGSTVKVGSVAQVSGVTANDFALPVTYTVTAQNGTTKNYTVTVTVAASSDKELSAFSLAEQTGAATIDTIAHTVAIKVAHGTSLNSLVATFSLSAGASAKVGTVNQVSGATANDFTTPVGYVITAADGSMQNWTVTVTVAASSAKELTVFSFEGLQPAVVGTISGTDVALTVPYGTAVTSLVATFTSSGGSTVKVGSVAQMSGVTANDFALPVIYTVTAQNGTTKNYIVTVTVAASSDKELTAFSLAEQTGVATVDVTTHTVAIEVAQGTSLNGLVATFSLSAGASAKVGTVNQVSGATANDFTTPLAYVITAADGSTQTWTVSVIVAASSDKELSAFSLAEQTGTATIDANAHTVAIEVAHGTSLNSLVATFSLSVGASAKVGNVNQVSGTTANDFTTPVAYVITAADGSTQNWTVTVTVAASSAKELTAFSFDGLQPAVVGTISGTDVALTVPYGTPVTSLVATFMSSGGSTVKVGSVAQVSGVTANDFALPATYTVTAQNGTTKNYTVTVTVAASSDKELSAFSLAEQTGAATIDATAHTVVIEVAHSTSLNSLVATFSLSAGASAKVGAVNQVSGATANDFTALVGYVITAADGSTQTWTVTVTVAASSAKELTVFSFEGLQPAVVGTISGTDVALTVPYGTPVTSLVATFTSSGGSTLKVGSVAQVSGVTANDFALPVIYTVTAQNGTTKNYTVTVTVAASSAKELTAFSLVEQTGAATIDANVHTVAIEAAHGTSLNSLVATFSLSAGASAKVGTVNQVSGTTANDFTTSVAYVITAADGSTQTWTVTVTVAASSEKNLTAFSLAEQTGAATIDATAHTVAIEVAHGTSLNSLVATFSLSAGASAKVGIVNQVSGTTANDFTTPVGYVITAADGSTQNWTVTVTVAASSAKDLTTFSFNGLQPAVVGTINGTDVALTVPYGTAVTSLVATFMSSGGSTVKVGSVAQVSEVTANDFALPVIYTVTAQNGTTKSYTVTVAVAASSEKELSEFSLAEQTGAATIDTIAHTVAIEVAHGTSLNGLVATFGLSAGASAKVGAVNQVSGATANDFTALVGYVITAADGSAQNWTVTVTVAANSAKELTAFSFDGLQPAAVGTINGTDIALTVPYGTAVTSLVATFTSSAGSTVKVGNTAQVSGATANDFTTPVSYTVTAQNGTTKNYTVTVTVAASSEKNLTAFSLAEQTGAATIDATAHTVVIEVAHSTSLNSLVATFSLSAGASAKVGAVNQVSGATANDFMTPVAYVIKAADGSTQNWTVTVTVAASSAKDLTAFSFEGLQPAVVGTINGTDITLTVPNATTVTSLVATFTSSAGSTVKVGTIAQTSGTTANDFTTPVTYTVTAQDGTTKIYTVTVAVAASSAKELTAFSFEGLQPAVVGTINGTDITLTVPNATAVTSLVATFTSSVGSTVKVGATAQVSGMTANDFAAPVTYTVTAQNGTTKNYTVTVTVAAGSAKELTAFSFEGLQPAVVGTINGTNITLTVPNATTVTSLVATFTSSVGSTVKVRTTAQVSGTTANDFTSPVIYTVTAQDGTIASYIVVVTRAAVAGDGSNLSALTLSSGGLTLVADTVTGTTYHFNVTSQIPSISVTASVYDSNSSIVGSLYNSGNVLVWGPLNLISGKSTQPIPLDVGSNRMELVVTDHNGSSKTYLVYVNKASAAYSNAQLQSLQVSDAVFEFNRAIFDYTMSVGNSVDVLTLKAFPEEARASVKINSEIATSKEIRLNAGRNLVTIEVTAQDGTTKLTYRVTIKRAVAITAVSDTSIQVTSEPVTITAPLGITNAKIAVVPITVGSNKEAILPLIEVQVETSQGKVLVVIPEGTKVTAPAAWDGTIRLPEVQSNNSVSVSASNVSGVIEMGSSDVTLTFDKAIRLLFPKQGGKLVGYVRSGELIPITGSVSADIRTTADHEIAPGGDAKITVGEDIVVWTKHFTKYVFYSPITPTISSGRGGGGGGPVNFGTILAAYGGTLILNGAQIDVPLGAIDSDNQVNVDKIGDISILPIVASMSLVSEIYEIKKDKAGDFSKAVIITLPFDRTKIDFTKSTVSLYWLNEKEHRWIQLDDQKVDLTNGTVSGTVRHFTKFAVLELDKKEITNPPAAVADFSDTKGHWAEMNIHDLVQLGVINGYSDDTFKPDNRITRAEFVTVIVKAFHLQAQTGKAFADTEAHWARSAIETASTLGVVTGYSVSTFGPDDLITREQMAVIVIRAAQIDSTDMKISFADNAEISDWARNALTAAAAKNLINGYEDGTVKPKANTTRAEALTVILRALQLQKK
ncbi:GLUG motif-containing protein [Paenibacillus radicis (ex Xue et al. 2023)]|uniref:S-layer homology domain-containing protein n=1 Tax=Paenibacillus radicis (ex Xue et al. 2023) TaxID=2972489 RepID=A0ABT1YHM7_9BACL|nr:GLUG motif-containing protein [Paenibacillus radicis (ex Xue et al. 2023)]MCR8632702.1 S-layer homology domain-containing protein [Paenibacillus radicis (ex Xue et al. 2023)]